MAAVEAQAAGAIPPARPKKRAKSPLADRRVVIAIRIASFLAVLGLWQLVFGSVNRALFAPPTDIIVSIVNEFTTEPSIWGPIGMTIAAFFIGMSLGILVGLPVGLIIGRYRTVEFVLDPYVAFLYVIPSVAFVPLFVLWFGFDFPFQVALVFESTLFPIMINAAAGAKNVESELVDGGRSFGASEWQIMRTIIVPGSLPLVFAGLRIAFSAAWVGVVVAQMTGALAGLGGLILIYATTYRTSDMLVPILVIMLGGVIIHGLTGLTLTRLTPWHQQGTETDGGS